MQLQNRIGRQFLLELIAMCPGKQSDLVMHFRFHIAFMHYFDSLTNELDVHILQNWTMHEQVLPISLQAFDFNSKLLETPKTLKRLCLPIQGKEGKVG